MFDLFGEIMTGYVDMDVPWAAYLTMDGPLEPKVFLKIALQRLHKSSLMPILVKEQFHIQDQNQI